MLRRLKAAGLHLLISLTIFGLILGLLIHYCYPWPYYEINGLFQGLRITASVDIVLGPLMTGLVYVQGKSKRALYFDFVVIAVVQIGALVYGVATLYSQRPVVTAFLDRGFQTLRMSDLPQNKNEWGDLARLREQSPIQPPLLAVKPPQSGEESVHMFGTEMANSGFPPEFTTRLEPVTAHWAQIVPNTLALPSHLPPKDQAVIDRFIQEHKIALQDIALFPVKGAFQSCTVAFTRKDGQFIGYMALQPDRYTVSPFAKKHG
ncbi:hypothetical protein [Silvimonas amylolytica]|uniref:Uncharacterized protein n=1 Tax=Silvimonas amylolytica TaxID=449663 RepID=A0ABQ2PPL1_9NEIS|nr:hypothetical protein [Silvimonas amylolytica]GGP27228.1 hypothetical protein GCM10010971_30470 [Silvimonas amylolytica]